MSRAAFRKFLILLGVSVSEFFSTSYYVRKKEEEKNKIFKKKNI
jgi:hypothetical protein